MNKITHGQKQSRIVLLLNKIKRDSIEERFVI